MTMRTWLAISVAGLAPAARARDARGTGVARRDRWRQGTRQPHAGDGERPRSLGLDVARRHSRRHPLFVSRACAAQPAFVAVAVLSLALAIGANSAVFSLADAMLLRPLPVPNPSALFDVSYTTPTIRLKECRSPTTAICARRAAASPAWLPIACSRSPRPTMPRLRRGFRLAMLVSDDFFHVTGVAPSAGRAFLPGEANAPVAMISYDFWRRILGRAAGDRQQPAGSTGSPSRSSACSRSLSPGLTASFAPRFSFRWGCLSA